MGTANSTQQKEQANGKTDWHWVYEAAGVLGWTVKDIMQASLPEIKLALDGRAVSMGLKPARDRSVRSNPIDLDKLMQAYPDK